MGKTEPAIKDQQTFYNTYRKQHIGDPLEACDFAFLPTCTGCHWILFIVDLRNMHVMIVDPLRDEKRDGLRKAYAHEIYVMVHYFFRVILLIDLFISEYLVTNNDLL